MLPCVLYSMLYSHKVPAQRACLSVCKACWLVQLLLLMLPATHAPLLTFIWQSVQREPMGSRLAYSRLLHMNTVAATTGCCSSRDPPGCT
jgi:hypothetical protein